MSQPPNDGFDPNDPIGTWRTIRDANLDAWAKSMTAFVNTETFSKAIGIQLDTLLAASAPVQKVVHEYMDSYLAQVNLPSRAEVITLATRLTNIEMRLDDMQAQMDDILAAIHALPRQPVAEPALTAPADETEPEPNGSTPVRRRTRKPAAE